MRIRSRLTLQFIIVVSLIIALSFGIIYVSSASYRVKELYQRLDNKAQTCAELFVSVDQIDSTMLRLFDLTQKDKLPLENISIYDHRNREVYTNNDSIEFSVTIDLLDEIRLSEAKRFRQGDMELLGTVYEDRYHKFVVIAGAHDVYGLSKLINLRNTLTLLFFGILTMVALAGWVYAGRALRPLSKVIENVNALDIHRLEMRLPENRHRDEIGELIATFNMLLSRIEHAFNLQRVFISGASHELKNPLTAITSQLQVSLLNERSQQEYRQLITSILDDIKTLNKTTNDLMEFSRLTHEDAIGLEPVRIDDIIWDLSETFRKTQPSYIVEVVMTDLPADQNQLIIRGHAALLRIAIGNILDNGCKFSSDHRCTVKLSHSPGALRVSVSDRGPGIPPEHIPLIFEPFYRGDVNAPHKGHGIGLALASKILKLHGAELSLESHLGAGTTFFIDFPVI